SLWSSFAAQALTEAVMMTTYCWCLPATIPAPCSCRRLTRHRVRGPGRPSGPVYGALGRVRSGPGVVNGVGVGTTGRGRAMLAGGGGVQMLPGGGRAPSAAGGARARRSAPPSNGWVGRGVKPLMVAATVVAPLPPLAYTRRLAKRTPWAVDGATS